MCSFECALYLLAEAFCLHIIFETNLIVINQTQTSSDTQNYFFIPAHMQVLLLQTMKKV